MLPKRSDNLLQCSIEVSQVITLNCIDEQQKLR